MLEDPAVRVVARAIDRAFASDRHCSPYTSGFNPYRGELYIGERSPVARLFSDPDASLRRLNHRNLLLHELWFLVHDYLHTWSTAAIADMRPSLGFGTAPITSDNLEEMAFCHLVTEAVATVGLDYWYLACTDMERILPIGSDFTNLTVSYRESDLPEYRRLNPMLTVQSPAFFVSMATFYCTGTLLEFEHEHLAESAKLYDWLEKEVTYGQTQREHTRMWLEHLSRETFHTPRAMLGRPVACTVPWQTELIHTMSELLWRKVKGNELLPFKPLLADDTWHAEGKGPVDFRFTNFNHDRKGLAQRVRAHGIVRESWPQLFAQVVSTLDYEASSGLLGCLPDLRRSYSPALLFEVTRHYPQLDLSTSEPADLFFPG